MLLPPGRCCSLLFLNVLGRCFAIFIVTDGIATVCYYGIYWDGRCYCQVVDVVTTVVIVAFWADVIAKVADVIATIFNSSCFGSCCCQGG